MADPPRYPNSRAPTGIPRWVKVFGIMVLLVAVLGTVAMLIGWIRP